jgi:ribosomal protein L11 methyltransferase
MYPQWIELRIRIPAQSVDVVSDQLVKLGCTGITVEERPLDTFVPPDPDEPPSGEQTIKAYFPFTPSMEGLRRRVQTRLRQLSRFYPDIEPHLPPAFPVRTEDWAEGWKQHFGSVRIGSRLVVQPTWEEACHAADDVVVRIDPGMAFGTGTHGTTRLCLEAIAAAFEETPPASVLDVGTGSGILAIAAAALGAARVLACDIDPEACRITRENADLNGVAQKLEVTDAPLDVLEGEFDLVVANILAEENIRLASSLVNRLAPGGKLILSGILREKEHMVTTRFRDFALSAPLITHDAEWSCILFRKP